VHDFLPEGPLAEVENLHDFAGMLVFDKWTCNTNGRFRAGRSLPHPATLSQMDVSHD
jgi:hypothetical protein